MKKNKKENTKELEAIKEEETKTNNRSGSFWGKLKDFVTKSVDCCKE